MSFFETRITKLFGIKYPIIQGGMGAGFVSTAELAAAVGNAGGIGFMSAIQWENDISKLEDEIKKVKDMTDKPFGVNMTLFTEVKPEFFHKTIDILAKHKVPAVESSARKPDHHGERSVVAVRQPSLSSRISAAAAQRRYGIGLTSSPVSWRSSRLGSA